MGMVVRSNIMAMNANRQLGMNNSKVGSSIEKLASGFRINRAGDDASGLAISEKMKAQIKGLETASVNSLDGISLVQTAEGALTEVHSMLNRMVELAGKAANGTMDNVVDRAALQKEVDSLKEEINRIAEGTNFNGIKLLDGTLGAAAQVSTVEGKSVSTTTPGTLAKTTITGLAAGDALTFTGTANTLTLVGTTAADQMAEINNFLATEGVNARARVDGTDVVIDEIGNYGASAITVGITGTGVGAAAAGVAPVVNVTDSSAVTTIDFSGKVGSEFVGTQLTIDGKTYEFVKSGEAASDSSYIAINVNLNDSAAIIAGELDAALATQGGVTGGVTSVVGDTLEIATTAQGAGTAAVEAKVGGKGLTLQIGDTADSYNKVTVAVNDMSCIGIGIDALSVADQDKASDALALLKNSAGGGAINVVSTQRAALGALQNRLEHTINNLDVAAENLSAANSRIRDTDMAKEMMEYTKMNVLTQAAQAMLSQANMQPQSILQLLQ